VRLEIATALKRKIRVIPVLVDGATMPSELPDNLQLLVRLNALEVSHNRFDADSDRLIAALERALEKRIRNANSVKRRTESRLSGLEVMRKRDWNPVIARMTRFREYG